MERHTPQSPHPNGVENVHTDYLDPSELGTKEYWDAHYTVDINAHDVAIPNPLDLESWFDDVDAPAKTLAFLTSSTFLLSQTRANASVLDLGTGNGAFLFALRLEGQYEGPMVGVDYSEQSVALARRLAREYTNSEGGGAGCASIRFEVFDILHDTPTAGLWFPAGGFDLVLDKGTFDAVSLCAETVDGEQICKLYPARAIQMVKRGGFLLVTSCNWTEVELLRWFTTGVGVEGELEVWGKIEYPVFEFGGQKGQGVASICFRRGQ